MYSGEIPPGRDNPSRACTHRARDGAFGIAIAVWSTLTILNLGFVCVFGMNFPFADDLIFLEVLSGEKPLSLGWLWTPLNEHRFPVVRLILWGLARLTNNDTRFVMLLSAVLSSASGLMLLLSVRHRRGRSHAFDIICPIFTMGWMHSWNLLSEISLHFAVLQFVMAGLLSGIMFESWRSRGGSLLWGILLINLPLIGGMGLVASAPVILFFIYAGAVQWRCGDRVAAGIVIAGALGAVVAVLIYLGSGRVTVDIYPPVQSFGAAFWTFLRAASLPFGPWVRGAWNVHAVLMKAGMSIWMAAVGGIVIHSVIRDRGARLVSTGLAACLASSLAIASAIGVARGGAGGNQGLAYWYVTMVGLLPVGVYFLASSSAGRGVRLLYSTAILLLALLSFVSGFEWGLGYGARRRNGIVRVVQSIRAGYPAEVINERYMSVFETLSGDALPWAIHLMKRVNQGPFDADAVHLPGEPSLLEFRPLRMTNRKGTEARVHPVDKGRTRLAGRTVYLESPAKDSAFTLPRIPSLGDGSIVVRLHVLSSTESIFRLVSIPSDPGGSPVEGTASCSAGSNLLDFVFADGEYENREWRLIPGASGGRYRLRNLSILELPDDPRFLPPQTPDEGRIGWNSP